MDVRANRVGDYQVTIHAIQAVKKPARKIAYKDSPWTFTCTDNLTTNEQGNTIAHELGHAFGNLDDIETCGIDDDNIMSYYNNLWGWELRKGQWDTTQAYHNP